MKAADDQVTRRKGTKAIPFRKHSIAARPPRGRSAQRGGTPGCSGLRGGGGRALANQLDGGHVSECDSWRDPRLREGLGRPGRERSAKSQERWQAAKPRGRGGWGAGGPSLLRNA